MIVGTCGSKLNKHTLDMHLKTKCKNVISSNTLCYSLHVNKPTFFSFLNLKYKFSNFYHFQINAELFS